MPEPPTVDRPIDPNGLREMALNYAARYATSTLKLRRYLVRKLRERGWSGDSEPELDTMIGRLVDLGYVNDQAFGEMRSRGLQARGFGAGRIRQDLAFSGLSRDQTAHITQDIDAMAAATAFARRRRFGRWDTSPADPDRSRRQYAAMLRAGHALSVIRAVLQPSGDDADTD